MFTLSLNTVGSTNDTARALAVRNPDAVFAVVADQQTDGRGRRGRTWRSPVGGVWMTIALPQRSPDDTTRAPLLAGLAVHRSITRSCALDTSRHELRIKWPNDVLLDARKVAGILCERIAPPDTPQPTLLVGIGVNANFPASELPPRDQRLPATTLRSTLNQTIEPRPLARSIADDLHALWTQTATSPTALPRDILRHLNGRLAYVGLDVAFERRGQRRTGTLERIDADGQLVVATADGTTHLNAGEVDRLTPDHAAPHHAENEPALPTGERR